MTPTVLEPGATRKECPHVFARGKNRCALCKAPRPAGWRYRPRPRPADERDHLDKVLDSNRYVRMTRMRDRIAR